MSRPILCPSVSGDSHDSPRIIGVIGRAGVVANISTPIPLTDNMRANPGGPPETLFRLAGPCSTSGCVHEFTQTVLSVAWHVMRAEATGQSMPIPDLLISRVLRSLTGCDPDTPLSEVKNRFIYLVSLLDFDDLDYVPVLSHIDPDLTDADYFRLPRARRRARLVASIKKILFHYTRQRPVVLIVEDYHWLDASSVDVVNDLCGDMDTARFLLLITTRPERRPGWGLWQGDYRAPAIAAKVEIELPPLTARQSDELLVGLLGDARELAGLRANIVARAGVRLGLRGSERPYRQAAAVRPAADSRTR